MEQEVIRYYRSDDQSQVVIRFDIESSRVLEIGKKINQINSEAYMNGYGWEAFIEYYFRKYYPSLIDGLIADPEAGCYFAVYETSEENENKAREFTRIILKLLSDEEKLLSIIRKEGFLVLWE